MFDNIGGKIKSLAKTVTVLGIIISVVAGVVLMAAGRNGGFIPGLITMAIGSLAAWLGSFLLYGFGTLVENSDIIARSMSNLKTEEGTRPLSSISPLASKPSPAQSWVCKECHTTNAVDRIFCKDCGKIK